MYKTILLLVSVSLAGCAALSHVSINQHAGKPSKVIVTLNGIGNDEGNIEVVIHDNQYSYYNDTNMNEPDIGYYQHLEVPAKSPRMQVEFNNIPAGKYAISAFHDENKDRKLNRMIFPFIGMPTENYGISNNAYAYFSKGSFEDALVEVSYPTTNVTIQLSHHISKIIGK